MLINVFCVLSDVKVREENSNRILDALHDASHHLFDCIRRAYKFELHEEKQFPTEEFILYLEKNQQEMDKEIQNFQSTKVLKFQQKMRLQALESAKRFRPIFEKLMNSLSLGGKESSILNLKENNDDRNWMRQI